MNSFLS